jgi:protein TonB
MIIISFILFNNYGTEFDVSNIMAPLIEYYKPKLSKMKKFINNTPDFDDVIFRDRNKEYGAYELRRSYSSTMRISIIAGMVFAISIVLVPFFNADRGSILPGQIIDYSSLPDPTLLDQMTPPEPPEPQLPPENIADQSKFRPPEVVADTMVPDGEIPTTDQRIETAVDGEPGEIPVVQPDPDPITPPEPQTYITAQEMPSFPGGEAALLKFIMDNVVYPADALENGIEGTVILQFVVTATGNIDRIVVTRKANPLLDAEAERVVSILPKWKPGKQDGNPVAVYFSLPVAFRIK